MRAIRIRVAIASLLLLVLGGGGYALYWRHVHHHPAQSAPARAPSTHVFAATGGRYETYDFLRNELKEFVVTDPQYGAKGDCSTDDHAAIVAADAAAAAAGGSVEFPIPAGGCYLTLSEIQPTAHRWHGVGTQAPDIVVRAGATMRSTLMIHYTGPSGTRNPFVISGMTIEGGTTSSWNADVAILRMGDWGSTYGPDLYVGNAKHDCIHAASHRLPLILSAVTATVPGGSPAGVTISQPDPSFTSILSNTNYVLKVQTGGALGTATYIISFDGGATFVTLAPVGIYAKSNLVLTGGLSYFYGTGIQVSFPAGTYAANDTYAFSATLQTEDSATNAVNHAVEFTGVTAYGCGTIAATTGTLFTRYFGLLQNVTTAPGTLTLGASGGCTSTACIAVGTGTTFLTGSSLRPGDILFGDGGMGPVEVAAVMDDLHILVANGSVIPVAASGAGYALGWGANYFEDNFTDTGLRISYHGGRNSLSTRSFHLHGSDGSHIYDVRDDTFAFAGIEAGGLSSTVHTRIEGIETKTSFGGANNWSIMLTPTWNGGTIVEPADDFLTLLNTSTNPVNIDINGSPTSLGGASSMFPEFSEQENGESIALSTGLEIIPPPSVNSLTRSHPSHRELSASGVLTMTSATPIGTPIAFWQRVELTNVGSNAITFPNTSNNLQMTSALVLNQWDSAIFYSRPDFSHWALEAIGKASASGAAVSSVTGSGLVSASPTTGAVSLSFTSGTNGQLLETLAGVPAWAGPVAAHATVIGFGTSGLGAVSAAAANKLFQAQGASSDPAWSAFTLAAPGTSGNLLQSDGTNWTSVTPTAPAIITTSETTGSGSITTTLVNALSLSLTVASGQTARLWGQAWYESTDTNVHVVSMFGSVNSTLAGTVLAKQGITNLGAVGSEENANGMFSDTTVGSNTYRLQFSLDTALGAGSVTYSRAVLRGEVTSP